jgi:hypothetical protein
VKYRSTSACSGPAITPVLRRETLSIKYVHHDLYLFCIREINEVVPKSTVVPRSRHKLSSVGILECSQSKHLVEVASPKKDRFLARGGDSACSCIHRFLSLAFSTVFWRRKGGTTPIDTSILHNTLAEPLREFCNSHRRLNERPYSS